MLIDVAKGFETSAGALEAAEAKVAHIEAAAMRAGLSRRAEMIRRRADEARGVELWERLLAVAASLDDLAASSEQCGIEIGHSSPALLQSGGFVDEGAEPPLLFMSTIVVSGCNDASINAGGPPQPRSSAAALAISHGAGVTIGLAVVVASTWVPHKAAQRRR